MPENTSDPHRHLHRSRSATDRPGTQQLPSRRTRRIASAPGLDGLHNWEIADLVAVGVLDAVVGQSPVPISVWRATGADEPRTTPEALFNGLTPRVAAILLAIYTDLDDLVVDATADLAVEGAAGAGGRRYRHLPHTRADGTAFAPDGSAELVLLRWPDPSTPACPAEPDEELVKLSAQLLTPDGHAVAILAPPAGGIYRDHARTFLAAATRAGLGYLQHIVVITGAGHDEQDDERDDGEPDVPRSPGPEGAREHLDLLVLVLSPTQAQVTTPGPASEGSG